ncbi:MAG: FAD-binding oxidoreductase [Nitrososphaerales archaeon]
MHSQSMMEYFADLLGPDNVIDPKSGKSENYLKDMGDYPSEPLIVLQPESAEQVSKIVSYARKTRTPIVARGAGTSLTGASSSHGGIVIDFSKKMKKILKIDTVNWYVHCQPGVVLEDLNVELEKKGFFFPPDPASTTWCTVGGAIAENSGGMRCFRYGTVKDWVYALEVALPDSSIVKLGEALPKNRVGYDLVHLICGSEGTLALITGAWLKIIPLPPDLKEHRRMLIFFDEWRNAGRSIQKIREERIQPVLMEFMDYNSIRAVNEAFEEMKIPVHVATLFIEADSRIEEILNICSKCGSTGYFKAENKEDGERLYNARALVYLGIKASGLSVHTEDVVVPIDRLADYLDYVGTISKKYGVMIANHGHAGDGNIHPAILYDSSSEESVKNSDLAFAEVCNHAIELGGSVSGEHGIGEQKLGYAARQLAAHGGSIEMMRKTKKMWDPENLFNPGKFLE